MKGKEGLEKKGDCFDGEDGDWPISPYKEREKQGKEIMRRESKSFQLENNGKRGGEWNDVL